MNLSADTIEKLAIVKALPSEWKERIDEVLDDNSVDVNSVLPRNIDLKVTALRLRIKRKLAQQQKLEEGLTATTWWDYRGMDAFEKTLAFGDAYEDVFATYSLEAEHLDMETRKRIAEGARPTYHYAKVVRGNVEQAARWAHFLSGRRRCDAYKLNYRDFCEGVFYAAGKRGWHFARAKATSYCASDKLWGGADGFTSATIMGYLVDKYANESRRSGLPKFQPIAYADTPEQREYWRWYACELVRVKGSEKQARRAWDMYHRMSAVPFIKFPLDDT